jgi:hypothetical protein
MINLLSVVYRRRFFSLGVAMDVVQWCFKVEAWGKVLHRQRFNLILACGRDTELEFNLSYTSMYIIYFQANEIGFY